MSLFLSFTFIHCLEVLKTSTLNWNDLYTLLSKFIISIFNGTRVGYLVRSLIKDKKRELTVTILVILVEQRVSLSSSSLCITAWFV
jgi:hypothetical protein